jgi:isopenicillin N synthase-like dioxygenase
MSRGEFSTIPVIDVSALAEGADPAARSRTVAELGRVLETIGFAYLAGHGVPDALVEAMRAMSRRFHALPMEAKLRIRQNAAHRGYMPFSTSTIVTSSVATVTKPNQSESLMVMHDLAPDDPRMLRGDPLAGPNQWPDEMPEIRDVALAYMAAMTGLGRRVAVALAEALDLPGDTFLKHFEDPVLWLRLLHYPQQKDEPDLYGSAPHTDYGFVTLLAQDDVGGLEVQRRDGGWIDAPPMPGAFVCNIGDCLMRWTNDVYVSTPHRVVNRTGRQRYSIAYFCDPNGDAPVECLPTCTGPDRPARYPPTTGADYLRERLDATYAFRRT